jgi:hypothetical protein
MSILLADLIAAVPTDVERRSLIARCQRRNLILIWASAQRGPSETAGVLRSIEGTAEACTGDRQRH